MIFFTTLVGAAQGLLLALVGVEVAANASLLQVHRTLFVVGGAVVLMFCAVGLVAATFHLGRPLRAWRAVAMWRTSWLSREVILLPLFMGVVLLWAGAHWLGNTAWPWGLVAALLALTMYVCTGMIYGAVKAIAQWAHPLTTVNYTVLGIASGLLLATTVAAWAAPTLVPPVLISWLGGLALLTTLLGAVTRGYALRRNLALVPKTTLQTAIGVRHPRIVQKAQGAMGGSFNTREFFHRRTPSFVRGMRWTAALLAFVLPVVALAAVGGTLGHGGLSAAFAATLFTLQYLGLLAERWSFFAEGQHTQNLYYSTVS